MAAGSPRGGWRVTQSSPGQRRVVVTGLGVVSPVGIGADVAWDALVRGQSGITDITLFD
ncbi:MAG: hypothetical protein M3O93_05515, partial [Chloroflexota bacterium]|nr:hypothetical protein [Chloroflexota bacterium]